MYEFHRDEMLYLEQGKHLDWGYMEVPPLLSIFSWLSEIAGRNFYIVKFWPSLFGALTVLVVCMLVVEMKGKMFAQFVAGLCMITGAYLRVHYLFQPNFLEIFFWTLSAYLIVRYINTQNIKFIYALVVSLALGCLSKYSITFFIAGIFVGLVLTSNRKLLVSRHLYYAALLFVLIILPNILWQYNHKWPVVHHMKELRETQLQYVNPLDFLKNQLLMHLPCFFVWIGGLIWLLRSNGAKPYRMIAWIFITVVVLLTITNGKDYYTLGAYPMIFAAGGVWLEQTTARRYWIRYAAVATVILLFIPIVPIALPIWKPEKLASYYRKTGIHKSGILKWEDLKEHPPTTRFC
jgi:4-amino-4-deoxy-L-arabinose transferase-like glycosyltransferase